MDMPRAGLLLIGQPRRGTSRLSVALTATGKLGRPEEYYWRGQELDWAKRLGVQPPVKGEYEAYLTAVMRYSSTPNGVFSAKMFWGHAEDLMARRASLPELSSLSDRQRFRSVFPERLYTVHVLRNCLRAAISLWRAELSGEWFRSLHETRPPVPNAVDVARVSILHNGQHAGDDQWVDLTQALEIPRMTLTFGAMLKDLPSEVTRVAAFVGEDVSKSEISVPSAVKQADAATEGFVRDWITETGGCDKCREPDA
jgi:LPS sulfotransferase NodH